jgi:hypothetical protein
MAGGESLSGKMRLKGKSGKWREMERFEWKVESGDRLFLCCRVLLFFSWGAARYLADGGWQAKWVGYVRGQSTVG